MHHGNNRESSARRLSKNSIVITTYGVINSELKNTVRNLIESNTTNITDFKYFFSLIGSSISNKMGTNSLG